MIHYKVNYLQDMRSEN